MRIRRHHVAAAQREAAQSQRVVDAPGYRQQLRAHLIRGHAFRHGEDQRVVLVGAQGLFEAPFRTQCKPAQPVGRLAEIAGGEFQLDDAHRQQVVERGDELGQLFRRHALRHHVVRHAADVGGGLLQLFNGLRMPYRRTDLAQAYPLQRKQVLFRYQPDQSFVFDHQHMPEPLLGHDQRGLMRHRLRRQGRQLRGHHIDHRLVQIDLRQRDARQHVGQRQNTERPSGIIDRHHRTDARLMHLLQRLAHAGLRRASDGRADG